ncbi:unnamed protein product [Prorocentrum cordatum]|uniref:Uncharacterized protein n=1 Tax=Prorocentrum cordatum TaxID=2364126 RepID=A0ABN9PUM5_9DINO|nr:unnamed protein product [Polarella glacialis]
MDQTEAGQQVRTAEWLAAGWAMGPGAPSQPSLLPAVQSTVSFDRTPSSCAVARVGRCAWGWGARVCSVAAPNPARVQRYVGAGRGAEVAQDRHVGGRAEGRWRAGSQAAGQEAGGGVCGRSASTRNENPTQAGWELRRP